VLDDAGLARDLRSLPVPARLLVGEELAAFVGRTPPLHDAAPEIADGTDRGDDVEEDTGTPDVRA
jgi:hypothetical protein